MKKLIILLVALTISTFTYWCNSVKANPLQSIEGKYKVKLAKLNFPADETKVKNAEELLLILAITLPETRKQLQNKINSISFVELKNNKLYLYDKNGKKVENEIEYQILKKTPNYVELLTENNSKIILKKEGEKWLLQTPIANFELVKTSD